MFDYFVGLELKGLNLHYFFLTLLCIIVKNGQTYFKNLPVEYRKIFEVCLYIMHERVTVWIKFYFSVYDRARIYVTLKSKIRELVNVR